MHELRFQLSIQSCTLSICAIWKGKHLWGLDREQTVELPTLNIYLGCYRWKLPWLEARRYFEGEGPEKYRAGRRCSCYLWLFLNFSSSAEFAKRLKVWPVIMNWTLLIILFTNFQWQVWYVRFEGLFTVCRGVRPMFWKDGGIILYSSIMSIFY